MRIIFIVLSVLFLGGCSLLKMVPTNTTLKSIATDLDNAQIDKATSDLVEVLKGQFPPAKTAITYNDSSTFGKVLESKLRKAGYAIDSKGIMVVYAFDKIQDLGLYRGSIKLGSYEINRLYSAEFAVISSSIATQEEKKGILMKEPQEFEEIKT